jgi:hypothetical protein
MRMKLSYIGLLFLLINARNMPYCFAENLSKSSPQVKKIQSNKDVNLRNFGENKRAGKDTKKNKAKAELQYSLSRPYDTNNPPPSGTKINPISSNAH